MLESCTAQAVNEKLLEIRNRLGDDLYYKIFGVIICDNGVEFEQLYLMEFNENGRQRGRVFYARPYRSGDKGLAENNHRLIRYIIPKGVSMDRLCDSDAISITNAINSINKNSINDFTPFELLLHVYGKTVLKELHLQQIEPDKLVLNASILEK